jgi:hypothetical protein
MWRGLSEEEKGPYLEIVAAEKVQYEKAMEASNHTDNFRVKEASR